MLFGIILVTCWSCGQLFIWFLLLYIVGRFTYDTQHCELYWFISRQLILTVRWCFYNESKACCWWVLRGLYLGNEFVFLSIRLFRWPLHGIFSCLGEAWITKIHVKIYDNWQRFCNMDFDWMVSLLPTNQKPDFNTLVSRCWKVGCIFWCAHQCLWFKTRTLCLLDYYLRFVLSLCIGCFYVLLIFGLMVIDLC